MGKVLIIKNADFSENAVETIDIRESFVLSVSANPSEGGTITGAGEYYSGTEVSVQAVANEGYGFDEWSDGISANPRTVVVDKNIELEANFKAGSKEITNFSIYEKIGVNYKPNGEKLTGCLSAIIPISNFSFTTIKVFSNDEYANYITFATGYDNSNPNTTLHTIDRISTVMTIKETTETYTIPEGSLYLIVSLLEVGTMNRTPQKIILS